MKAVTWQQLEPMAVTYAAVNIGRLTRSVLNVSRDMTSADRQSGQHWLCHNTPLSVLGLAFAVPQDSDVRAVVLEETTNLVLGIDHVRTLPAGTDVRAVYSDGRPQFITFDLPDPHLGVRFVPPFCARLHNGQVLAPQVASLDRVFTPFGQMELLVQARALAVHAGSNSHVADIDRRLALAQRLDAPHSRPLPC